MERPQIAKTKMWWVWRLRVFFEKLIYGAPRESVIGLAIHHGSLLVAQIDPEDGLIYAQCVCTIYGAKELRENLDIMIARMELVSGTP